MPEDFEWHTEEEQGWGEQSPATAKPRRSFPRLFLVLVLMGLAASVAGLLIFRLVNSRAADATETVEANILTVHQLIQQADQLDDLDLFRSSLSNSSQIWSEVQMHLLIAGSLMDRPAFYLRAISNAADDSDIESQEVKNVVILLSPDLTSAEVQFDQTYLVEEGYQAGRTINLRQTAVYRLGERWLLASPHSDFWGGKDSLAGELLQVTFPERDKVIVERLASDLDDLLGQACRTLVDLACPESLQIKLHLEEEIEYLAAVGQAAGFLGGDLDLHLPTPTLVGLPVDEDSYQVFRRAYGLILLTSLIGHQAGYQCCQQGPFYQALLDAQLHDLGVSPWPLETSLRRQPEKLGGSSLRSLNDVGLYWSSSQLKSPVEEIWPVYSLVNFLIRLTGRSAGELQRALSLAGQLPNDVGYEIWLQIVTENLRMGWRNLELAWLAYNEEAFLDGQEKPPVLPDQDLMLSCFSYDGLNMSLYRYHLSSDELVQEAQFESDEAFIIGIPDDEGVIVAEKTNLGSNFGTRLWLWLDGREDILVESLDELVPLPFAETSGEVGENLMFLNRRTRQYSLLPFQDCQYSANCAETTFNGFPVWSPDGSSHLLLVSMGSYGYESRFERPLSLGSVSGALIGVGKEPFWLDGNTAAFISPQGKELITVDTLDVNQRVLLTVKDVANALQPSQVSDLMEVVLEYASINPNERDTLLIIAKDDENAYFLSADHQGNGIRLEHFTDEIPITEFGTDFQFSPDGRWLVISSTNPAKAVSTITFYDSVKDQSITYPFHGRYDLPIHWHMDWSGDGRWLSIIVNGYVRLFNPESEYQRLIMPDELICTAAAWIN